MMSFPCARSSVTFAISAAEGEMLKCSMRAARFAIKTPPSTVSLPIFCHI